MEKFTRKLYRRRLEQTAATTEGNRPRQGPRTPLLRKATPVLTTREPPPSQKGANSAKVEAAAVNRREPAHHGMANPPTSGREPPPFKQGTPPAPDSHPRWNTMDSAARCPSNIQPTYQPEIRSESSPQSAQARSPNHSGRLGVQTVQSDVLTTRHVSLVLRRADSGSRHSRT